MSITETTIAAPGAPQGFGTGDIVRTKRGLGVVVTGDVGWRPVTVRHATGIWSYAEAEVALVARADPALFARAAALEAQLARREATTQQLANQLATALCWIGWLSREVVQRCAERDEAIYQGEELMWQLAGVQAGQVRLRQRMVGQAWCWFQEIEAASEGTDRLAAIAEARAAFARLAVEGVQ